MSETRAGEPAELRRLISMELDGIERARLLKESQQLFVWVHHHSHESDIRIVSLKFRDPTKISLGLD